MYLNNTQTTHCCISASTVVTRTRHNFIVYLNCVSYFMFCLVATILLLYFLSFLKKIQHVFIVL